MISTILKTVSEKKVVAVDDRWRDNSPAVNVYIISRTVYVRDCATIFTNIVFLERDGYRTIYFNLLRYSRMYKLYIIIIITITFVITDNVEAGKFHIVDALCITNYTEF